MPEPTPPTDTPPVLCDLLAQLTAATDAIVRLAEVLASPTEAEALATRDVAKLCGVSESKVRELNAHGLIPSPIVIGQKNCPRWLARELRAWLSAGAPSRAEWERLKPAAMRRAG